MDKSQQQLASGRTINKPSDNPTGTARSMQLRTNLVETNQYITNTDYAISWVESAESALSNVTDVMQRARELAIQGANGVLAQNSRDAIGKELEQLRQQLLLELANASNGGRFIFGGAKTVNPPFSEKNPDENMVVSVPPSDNNQISNSLNANDVTNISGGNIEITLASGSVITVNIPNVTGMTNEEALKKAAESITAAGNGLTAYCDKVGDQVRLRITSEQPFTIVDTTSNLVQETSASGPYKKEISDIIGYNGDNTKLYVQVGAGGVNLDINVPGGEPFSSNIAAVINLRNAMLSGDAAQIQSAIGYIDKAIEVTLTERSDLGARANRLELIRSRLEELDLNFNKLLSNNEDTDIAGVITDLKMQESVQRAALATGAKIIVPTLVDFIR